MEGVTILNTIVNPIMGFSIGVASIFWFAGFVTVCALIWVGIKGKEPIVIAAIIIVIFITISMGFITGANIKQIGTYETYEVTIDNSVNFNEFVEHYTIVDQRGAIYEVRPKDEGTIPSSF